MKFFDYRAYMKEHKTGLFTGLDAACRRRAADRQTLRKAYAEKKPGWIDFNAGVLLDGADMEALADQLFNVCIACAEGKETRGETRGFYDIAIFKDGVTL